jgi:hypothetical protein
MKLVIIIKGGVLCAVYGSLPLKGTEVVLIDYDDLGADDFSDSAIDEKVAAETEGLECLY